MRKFLLCAVVFLSAAAPAAASESLTVYGFDVAQLQTFILATYDGAGQMDVIDHLIVAENAERLKESEL